MIGSLIKTARCLFYKYPQINEDIVGTSSFGNLKVALLTDYLTSVNISYECRIKCLTVKNYSTVLKEWHPDIIFIESAFHGFNWSWSYKLAKHPKIFDVNYLKHFKKLINLAQDLKIPTVFWNKDDGAFFETFIEAASLCDYIYTADSSSIVRYKNYLYSRSSLEPQEISTNFQNYFNDTQQNIKDSSSLNTSVLADGLKFKVGNQFIGLLKMAIQPRIHCFKGFNFSKKAICFAGSYYRRILDTRRLFLNDIFSVCAERDVQLDIFDRNSNRISRNLDFKFPKFKNINVLPKLSNEQTADAYRQYHVSLNVNSITDSETMCSRRLLEIIACGGIVATNNSKAVENLFKDYCVVINSKEEAMELLPNMVLTPSKVNLEKAQAGSIYVSQNFSWEKRLEQLAEDLKF